MGIDRDRDGWYDGDEVDRGSDPADPNSVPTLAVAPGAPIVEGLRRIGPNPFHLGVEVEFALARGGDVDLRVYDLLGREVRVVARGLALSAGPHRLSWDGRDVRGRAVGSGVYFVKLKSPAGSWTRAIVKIG